jgi:hypothetical protein
MVESEVDGMKHLAPVTLAFLLLGCAAGGPADRDEVDRVPVGEWGGEHIRLTVMDAGGSVEFDCAHGTLDAPLQVDERGRFDVAGSFTREGGPVMPGGEDKQSVRYTGKTDGRSMDLEIVPESGERIGPFRLKLGERAKLFKCL